uniref:Uncharacterized protein n=1 Tax=Lygus hesperus TaxID=30085 RepID=A0A0K8SLX6_LYGHE
MEKGPQVSLSVFLLNHNVDLLVIEDIRGFVIRSFWFIEFLPKIQKFQSLPALYKAILPRLVQIPEIGGGGTALQLHADQKFGYDFLVRSPLINLIDAESYLWREMILTTV